MAKFDVEESLLKSRGDALPTLPCRSSAILAGAQSGVRFLLHMLATVFCELRDYPCMTGSRLECNAFAVIGSPEHERIDACSTLAPSATERHLTV
jgi:hypothetical protein